MPERWRSYGSAALAALGVGAVGVMLSHIGLGPIASAFERTGIALLGLFLLELTVLAAEARVAGIALGVAPSIALGRGAIAAYLAALVLPAGRMAGELVRAIHLDGEVPRGRSAMGIVAIHGTHVTVGASCALVLGLLLTPRHPVLGATVLACGAWAGLTAACLLTATRSLPVAQWLARRMGLSIDVASARIDGRALLHAGVWAVIARLLHVAQAILLARALFGPDVALHAGAAIEALQHVAGSVGDAVPGQAGVLEGTFAGFAAVLSPGSDGARATEVALAAALVLRAVRLGLGAVLGVAQLGLASRSVSVSAAPS